MPLTTSLPKDWQGIEIYLGQFDEVMLLAVDDTVTIRQIYYYLGEYVRKQTPTDFRAKKMLGEPLGYLAMHYKPDFLLQTSRIMITSDREKAAQEPLFSQKFSEYLKARLDDSENRCSLEFY